MSRHSWFGWFVALIVVTFSIPVGHAEDPTDAEKPEPELTQPFVDEITLFAIREDGTRYAVSDPKLIMRSFDHERGRTGEFAQSAAHWVWGDGRPVAITVFWRWQHRETWGHSFISTSPGRLVATCEHRIWTPEQPGLQFARLEDVPVPSEMVEDRLEQMTKIAQRFTGEELVRDRVLDLQILPDPLYQYQAEDIDGAIFGLARNGSPYGYLFLEAVSDPVESRYWRHGWIKGTSSHVNVMFDGRELLHIPGDLNFVGEPTEPFWVFFRDMPGDQAEQAKAAEQAEAAEPVEPQGEE
jgi:hypothetical protein